VKPPLQLSSERQKEIEKLKMSISKSPSVIMEEKDYDKYKSPQHDEEIEDGIDYDLEKEFHDQIEPNKNLEHLNFQSEVYQEMLENQIQGNHLIQLIQGN